MSEVTTDTSRRSGVALGGFMGTGKSTIGRALARHLHLPFVDTDAVLVQRYGPIPTQFARDGEATFRARERALIAELAETGGRVLATGGGVWVDVTNRDLLRRNYHMVVLTAPWDVLTRRAAGDPTRPLWDDAARARWLARQAAYADAELIIDTGRCGVDEAVAQIVTTCVTPP